MEDKKDLVSGGEWKPPSLASPKQVHTRPTFADVWQEDLIAEHQLYTDEWRSSSDYFACHELLTNTVLNQSNIQITQCMCLFLHTLSGQSMLLREGAEKTYVRGMSQLVAFEGWVELLSMCHNLRSHLCISQEDSHSRSPETKHNITKIFFQDPLLNSHDKQFLSSRGYIVLDTPQSDLHMSETTFLFAHNGPWEVSSSLFASKVHFGMKLVQNSS